MTWIFIISTTVWVNGWDTSSVASRARSELTSSQCSWKGNRKGKGTDETPHSASIPVTAVSRNKTIMGLSLLLLHSRFLLKGKQFYQECQSNVKTSALLQTQSVGTILNEIS